MEIMAKEFTQIKEFVQENKQSFEQTLLKEAVNVKDKINEILKVGKIDLVNNAHNLVIYVIDSKEKELLAFAKQEGIAWATQSIPLSFKLEWIQAIRRTIWTFVQKYNQLIHSFSIDDFFKIEQKINNHIDQFLNAFFINYSTYKDSLIAAQRKLVENLSVPIIPITKSICILPLIGSVDTYRSGILEEKVLVEIGKLRMQTLIMDLSGIAEMESDVIEHIMKIIQGTSLMGCNCVITGLRAEVVRKMIHMGVKFDKNAKTLGTLQQALREYLVIKDSSLT
jgi:rsbT co-antagonist protein RsbR